MVNPNYTEINARAALADPDSVFYYYQKLIRLRHEHPVIAYGTFEPLLEESDSIYAYRRVLDGQTLVVACNWTGQDQPCSLFPADDTTAAAATEDHPEDQDQNQEELISNHDFHTPGKELISNYSLHKPGSLQPYEARAVLYPFLLP